MILVQHFIEHFLCLSLFVIHVWVVVWVSFLKKLIVVLSSNKISISSFKHPLGFLWKSSLTECKWNWFQVNTVAYHLSVLKGRFPNGINVLSLFSGIGGAEVALHRLGMMLKNVVSVEIAEVNRNIIRSWWEQTNQRGNLIEVEDVQKVSSNELSQWITKFGGFDLIIGGSPCNNISGSNRVSRHGLEGEQSSLFYEYFRIVEAVMEIQRDELLWNKKKYISGFC